MPEPAERFVGREALVAQLDETLAAAAAGRGCLVVLAGEAGIGKTRLAQQCARRAAGRGFTVAWSACGQDDGAPGFWPWTQLVNAILATDPDLAAGLGAAARLTTVATREPAAADPELARFALFDAVTTFVTAAVQARPLLMVIDDVQWADVPSLSLLAFAARRLPAHPVAVIATCRDGEAIEPPARHWLDELPRHGTWLTLGGLSDSEMAGLVSQITGQPVAPEVVTDVRRRTGGNPLFATEIARLARAQRTGVAQVAVPDSIRALLRGRLDRLSADARRLLTTAAVIGSRFRADVLAAAADVAPGRSLELLDEIARYGFVREDGVGRYGFAHDLVRDAVYLDLGLARRVRLHERIADALAHLVDDGAAVDPAELAHHFAAAAPAGRAGDAVPHLRATGDRAMRMLAYEEAVRHYTTALELLDVAPSAGERAALLLALGDARTAAGDRTGAREAHLLAAEAARATGTPEQLAAAALGLSGGTVGFEVTLFDRQQIALLEEALAGLDDGAPLRPVVLARLSVALSLDTAVERRATLSREAVALARAGDDPAALAYALAAHCDAIAGPGDAEARVHAAEEIVALAAESGDARMELLGRRLAVVALLEIGDTRGADAQIAAFARLATTLRQPLFGWYVPLWRGMQALAAGRVVQAADLVEQAEGAGRRADSDNAAMLALVLRWWLQIETGRWDDAKRMMAEMAERVVTYDATVQVGIAFGEALAGEHEPARQRLTRVGVDGLAAIPADSEWLSVLAQASLTVGLVGGHEVAGWLYATLLPHRRRFVVEGIGVHCLGAVERFLGILAAALRRPDEARSHLGAALTAHEAAGMPLAVASTLRDGAVALGDPDWRRRAADAYDALSIEPPLPSVDDAVAGTPPAAATAPAEGVFARDGELWRLSWADRTVHVNDSKGMHDLARLLQRPGREVPAMDLAGVAGGAPGGDLGEVIDAQARAAYRTRLAQLEEDIAEADRAGDAGRSARATAERDALVKQLTAAYGLGGRPRRSGDPMERARSAVSWRIRDAIRRIEAVHPDLGRHLRHAIRTGRYVAYDPELPATWTTG